MSDTTQDSFSGAVPDSMLEHSTPTPDTSESPISSTRRATSWELAYAGISGFLIGFAIAAAVLIVVLYFLKHTEGIDGE